MSDPVLFVSYSHEDKPIAGVLAEALRSGGGRGGSTKASCANLGRSARRYAE